MSKDWAFCLDEAAYALQYFDDCQHMPCRGGGKMAKTLASLRRLQLDDLLRKFPIPERVLAPPSGWVQAVRQALGMTQAQLARRLRVTRQSVQELERAEATQRITLGSLNRLASAMGCRLVYAVVPEGRSTDQLRTKQARALAAAMMKSPTHSMKLEGQGLSAREQRRQLKLLTDSLLRSDSGKLWQ